ncbi:MAG: DUF4126 domain-containing protein [Deltaproteobacteria bacterium]|nr:DUF4126 domain-containing protein [Deltaproteobacteria bacterium]
MEFTWSGLGGLMVGVGLAAACGFRIILPFLGLSIAGLYGIIPLAPEFQWIATRPALIAFGTAAILEIAAYYVPWMDNLLDSVATPLAVAAGTLAAASVVVDLPPLIKWSLAIIAGGGMASIVQTGTTILRGVSTLSTGGAGNFILSTAELAGALATTLLSLLLPLLAFAAACLLALWVLWKLVHRPAKPG